MSYSKSDESNQIRLHIFRFNGGRPLELMASHVIFTGNSFDSTEFCDSRLFEGVYCYQWSSDDNYLMTIVAPQYPNSKLIDVTVIRIDRFGSYVVSPGSQQFSCNGFGRIPVFCDEKTISESALQELLCPKVVMNRSKICSFITDSEIVCLEIKEVSNQRTGLLDSCLEYKVLDVDSKIFADMLDKYKTCLNLIDYLSEYELLVYDIQTDPIRIFSLLEVMFIKNNKKLLHSLAIEWQPKSMKWNLNLFSQNNEQEVHKPYYCELIETNRTIRRNTCYSINNLSLTEDHKSLSRLDSPVDAFSIILH